MSYAVLQHLEFVSETDFHFFLRIQCPKHLYYEKKKSCFIGLVTFCLELLLSLQTQILKGSF